MKREEIRSAYDSVLPSSEAKEELLQRILAAASDPQPEGNGTTMKVISKKCMRLAAIAAALVLALTCTVMASSDALGGVFGLWLGGQKIKLDELSPVDFALDAYLAEHGDGSARYKSYDAFTEETGMELTDSAEIRFTDIWVEISSQYRMGHMGMDIEVDGETAYANATFLLEGSTKEEYGYGYSNENVRAYYVYEYAEGRKAYFVKDDDAANIAVYFTENGVMYQLFVSGSAEKELGRRIVDCIAGVEN